MKTIFSLLILTFMAVAANAQDPVSWTFTSKKIDDKTYEVHMKANIQSGWHLYSQDQPKDAIAFPTEIVFTKNPLFKTDGKVKEVGKVEKFTDKTLGVTANQYSNTVDFVQVIKLRGNAKTNVSGTVEFQVCDDEKCLRPKKVNFNIALK